MVSMGRSDCTRSTMVSMGTSEATALKRPSIPYWGRRGGGGGGGGGGAFKGAKLVKQNTIGLDPLVMHQYFTMNTFAYALPHLFQF